MEEDYLIAMASIQKNFASLVALGSQNTQIINEEFLKNNEIIPRDSEPFNKQTDFLSTPPFSTIQFGPVEILVEEHKFQIREKGLTTWDETQIFDIAKKYYGVLKYTPIKVVGLNFHCLLTFDNSEEADSFHKLLLPNTSQILQVIPDSDIDISLKLHYPHDTGRVLFSIEKLNPDSLQRQLCLNYEFDCFKDGKTEWGTFNSKISQRNEIEEYFAGIVNRLLGVI